jgi:NAD(P)H-dependent FMN reductase
VHVATLCGSLHSGSTNAVVLGTITERLAAAGAEIEAVDVSVEVPALRPEEMEEPPAAVRSVRAVFERADGVVFAVPEYAGGLPGWVKNITDWMVSSASLFERPAAVVSAATAGGANAIAQLARTLTWQGSYVVATHSIAAPLTMVRDGTVTDPDAAAGLDRVADVLAAVMRGDVDRAEAAAAALTPLGIDPHDRLS